MAKLLLSKDLRYNELVESLVIDGMYITNNICLYNVFVYIFKNKIKIKLPLFWHDFWSTSTTRYSLTIQISPRSICMITLISLVNMPP